MYISKATKFKLFLQQLMAFCCLFLVYFGGWIFIFVIKKYKVSQVKNLRKQFKIITQKINQDPLLICPNHLTYIDSLLLIITFNSFFGYMKNFHTLAWNFPKINHVKDNWLCQIVAYLGKCIFINFEKPKNNNDKIIKIAKYLLSAGQYIMLFPEGHRSTDGKVDTKNFAYGVGKLIQEVQNTKVLCVYLRGNTQQYGSNFPNKYDKFYCKIQLVNPLDKNHNKYYDLNSNKREINFNYANSQLRQIRNISKNIVEYLAKMEQDYFNTNNTNINKLN